MQVMLGHPWKGFSLCQNEMHTLDSLILDGICSTSHAMRSCCEKGLIYPLTRYPDCAAGLQAHNKMLV